jgi:hypothetical protein
MHKDAFNSLTLDEKADLVFQKDAFVDTRVYYVQTISLYLVNGFYAEVWYLPNENRIVDISLPTSDQLSLYKTPLDLNSLL